MINLRDKGAEIWENQGRVGRIVIAVCAIAIVAALPLWVELFLILP